MSATIFPLAGCVAIHQLVEIAGLPIGGCFLKQERQAALVKFIEPVVPRDFLQRSLAAISGKVDAENANVFAASSACYVRWLASTFFRPLADFLMIGGNSTAC